MADAIPTIVKLDSKLAHQILRYLRDGTTPPGGVEHLHVDRGGWVRKLDVLLQETADNDLTELRIMAGSYGAGKSHALAAVTALGLSKDWVVARLNVNRDLGAVLDPFALYLAVAQALITRDRAKSDPTSYVSPVTDGLRWVLERFAERHRQQSATASAAERSLADLFRRAQLHPDVERAASKLVRAHWDQRDQVVAEAWAWFTGSSGRSAVADLERPKPADGFRYLESVVRLVRACGYRGLLVTLDEAESILRERVTKRTRSWEILRQAVDLHGAPGLLLLVGMTVEGLNSDKGPMENDALRSRLKTALTVALDGTRPFRATGTILNLDRLEYTTPELKKMAEKLLHVFGAAHTDLPATDESDIERAIHEVERICEQRPTLRARALMQFLVDDLSERRETGDESIQNLERKVRDAVRAAEAGARGKS